MRLQECMQRNILAYRIVLGVSAATRAPPQPCVSFLPLHLLFFCRNAPQGSTVSAPDRLGLPLRPECPPLLAWAAVFSASAVGTPPHVTLRPPYVRCVCVHTLRDVS